VHGTGWEGVHQGPCAPYPSDGGAAADQSLDMAHKLDPLMCLLLSYMTRRAARGATARRALADACLSAFDRVVLLSHRVKFSAFVIFHALAEGDAASAPRFVTLLTDRVCDPVRTLPGVVGERCTNDAVCVG
jgi:hypothetical protein